MNWPLIISLGSLIVSASAWWRSRRAHDVQEAISKIRIEPAIEFEILTNAASWNMRVHNKGAVEVANVAIDVSDFFIGADDKQFYGGSFRRGTPRYSRDILRVHETADFQIEQSGIDAYKNNAQAMPQIRKKEGKTILKFKLVYYHDTDRRRYENVRYVIFDENGNVLSPHEFERKIPDFLLYIDAVENYERFEGSRNNYSWGSSFSVNNH